MMSNNLQMKVCTSLMYFLSLIMFLNSSSMLMFWVLMEVNMILLIVSMYVFMDISDKSVPSGAFRYLVVQTLGSMIFFMSMTMESSVTMEFTDLILVACLSAKMGIFPFHSWVFQMNPQINSLSMTLILTTQKIPMIMVLGSVSSRLVSTILIVTALAGSLMLASSKNLGDLIVSSSIYFTFWTWILWTVSMSLFLIVYMIYAIFTFMLMGLKQRNSKGVEKNTIILLLIMASMFLIGLPPASMFFFKLSSVSLIWESLGMASMMVVWMSVLLSTFGYLTLLLSVLSSKSEAFIKSKKSESSMMISMILQSIFFLYMIL